jgi:hypothetical protein
MRTFGIAETARILETDIDTVKKWCYLFQRYLSPQANPARCSSRIFTIEDIRVFCYVYMYWEEDPDIECIKIGLNSNSQYDNLLIDNTIMSITPLFIPIPTDIDESWRGVVFGGEFELGDLFDSANSFKLAGDRLIEVGLKNYEQRELFQPAMYCYRHSLELYIKSIVGEEMNHDLKYLFSKLIIFVKLNWSQVLPQWLHQVINSFDSVDPQSTGFRYGTNLSSEELYADLSYIKGTMEWATEIFTNIRFAKDGLS